jgi:hypothetical protein
MATAYVTSTGTATYPGTLALPTSLTNALAGAGAGDTINIAAGNYTGISGITYGGASGTSGSPVKFIGDTTGAIFGTAGAVRVTAAANISTGTGAQILTVTDKNYIEWSNLIFDRITPSSTVLTLTTCTYFTFSNCIFYGSITATNSVAAPWSHTFQRCVLLGSPAYSTTLSSTNTTVSPWQFLNCIIMPINTGSAARSILINSGAASGGLVSNCLFYGAEFVNFSSTWSTSNPIVIKNCVFAGSSAIYNAGTTSMITCSYNRYTFSSLTGVSAGTGSTTGGILGSDMFESLLTGFTNIQPYSSVSGSPNASFGTASGAPATDMYGVTWTGTSPDAGPATYRAIGGVSPYLPSERNASAITIAPASTSQSIELYLGATGLTFSTSGLAAYYVRNQSAPMAITLVTQTPTGAWSSGGFAEISSSLVPGVYRLDVPNAAFAAGASDVTIVVRGASGTNGAVLTVTLSSGGLTAAQTAAAVWDEPYTSHTTASTFGARTLKTVADNRLVNVGTANHIEANVHAIVDSTAAASELSGALLHNGTDYISANLLTPVSAATSVHIGPYQLLADGLGADQPLDVNVGTATSIDVQVTDANGTGIDITGATVSAKVYSSAGTLVATYAGTATYADNGRLSFGLTTTVTATSGTYTITVTRTTGATDTQIFGPLRLYVRPV